MNWDWRMLADDDVHPVISMNLAMRRKRFANCLNLLWTATGLMIFVVVVAGTIVGRERWNSR